MNWKNTYFSVHGRISRRQWWISHLIQWGIALVLGFAVMRLTDPSGTGDNVPDWAWALFFVGFLFLAWTSICINAKRWHDTDNTGWLQLMGLLPVVGLWALVANGFFPGTDGPNSYGSDPRAR